MPFSIEIDLNAILNNVKVAKSGAKDKMLCAVVKANAYGHGARKVCSKIENEVDYFAVATGEEGKSLRKFGIYKPILVLSPTDSDTNICINYDLSLSIGCKEQAKRAFELFERKGKSCPIHLQIDSGMHRFGFSSVSEVIDTVKLFENYSVCGVYSHVYSNDSYLEQIDRFISFERVVKDMCPNAISHLSSTSYVFNPYGDMVRVGLGLYGYPRTIYKPAMKISSEVLCVREIEPQNVCGYDGIYLSGNSPKKVAVIKGGYADGILRNRRSVTGVLFQGEILPIVAVCMDSVIVLLSNQKIKRGDKIYFVGEMNNTQYYFDEISRQIGTIPYELMTNVSNRARRRYIDFQN